MITEHEDALGATDLGVVVADVSDIDASWTVMTILPVRASDRGIEATLTTAGGAKVGKTYEIKALELRNAEGVAARLVGGRDFSRTFFRTRANANDPTLSAEEVAAVASEIERERDAQFAVPLGHSEASGADEFRVLMLVERLLLTNYMRVPGIELLPLKGGNTATDEASIVNEVLTDLGWNAGLDPNWWANQNARERPIVLFRIPRLLANSHEDALRLAHLKRDRLLDLLALHRGSSGVPFATIVQRLVDVNNGRYAEARIYPEGKSYTGNLIGGSISGEDSRTLMLHDRATERDTFLRLLVSLYREARAESNTDHEYFRLWSLLEVLAADRIEAGEDLTDFDGNPVLLDDGTTANTRHARGRVYELLKRWMQKREFSRNNFTRPVADDLWEAVGMWNARRNATAHYGAFVAGDLMQESRSWYPRALKSHEATVQHQGFDYCLFNLREAANKTLQWELYAAGSSADTG